MADTHYVWCSEEFDSRMVSPYSSGSLVPPSSNPADIFRELRRDVENSDQHSAKINAQKVSLTDRAIEWEKKGLISTSDKNDIVYLVDHATFAQWKPLIYVIPRPPVETRLAKVPMHLRAGIGTEYIISDLKRFEFEILEL